MGLSVTQLRPRVESCSPGSMKALTSNRWNAMRAANRLIRSGPLQPGQSFTVNAVAGYSNYGKYIVVRHTWDGCDYYSLYGHLSSVQVQPGQTVQQRDQLGVMGHTGDGLDRVRAHLHLELNLMMSGQFGVWHDSLFKTDPNRNGLYNGLNLVGLDIARLYLALQKQPSLTIPEFLAKEETLYRVVLPNSPHFDLLRFYPWMRGQEGGGTAPSWEVSFNRAGVPLRIQASQKSVTGAELSYLKPTGTEASYMTRGHVSGRGESAHLTGKGKQFLRLLTYP